jgi:hypothetical protein
MHRILSFHQLNAQNIDHVQPAVSGAEAYAVYTTNTMATAIAACKNEISTDIGK